jgi:phosphoribosylformylglycinamidine cyclo-ligase
VKYKDAGVNIDVADKIVKAIGSKAKTTLTEGVLRGVGPFGAMYRLSSTGLETPVLVSSIDGVGTKLKICSQLGAHEGAGYDIVSHCANDVLAEGAKPLFVLDYIGMSALDPGVVEQVVDGMVRACVECGCALIGGETAELPGTYPDAEYELVACMLGVVDESKIVDGASIAPGDVAIGLPSSGLHTNGYSLARKVLLELRGFSLEDRLSELGTTVGAALLAPHRQYVRPVLPLVDAGLVKGIAHITGGGLPGNVSRILPEGTGLAVRRGSWETPAVFKVIQREGEVAEGEMFRTFNMGIGLVLIVDAAKADDVARSLEGAGERSWRIGEVVQGAGEFELID